MCVFFVFVGVATIVVFGTTQNNSLFLFIYFFSNICFCFFERKKKDLLFLS